MSTENFLTERLLTRGYELAEDGTLPLAAYMRYLEHMRWMTRGRLHDRRATSRGVVRAQRLQIYAELGPHVELELSAWISRVGRTSMDMSHDIVRVADGELIGRGSATLVALDEAGRPAPFLEAPGPTVLDRPSAEVARPGTDIPAEAFCRSIEIRRSDHDNQGHVNQARYGELIDDTRLLCAAAGGYGEGPWTGRIRGFSISYERESRAGDPLNARTWIAPGDVPALEFQLDRGADDVVARARVEL